MIPIFAVAITIIKDVYSKFVGNNAAVDLLDESKAIGEPLQPQR
jgi:hypothetical protein